MKKKKTTHTHKHTNTVTTYQIRVITKLPNTEQYSKGKGKTHKSTNRQNQSTTGKLVKKIVESKEKSTPLTYMYMSADYHENIKEWRDYP